MALSGSWDFTKTRNDIIKRGLRLVGALEQGQDPTADEILEAAEALEDTIKDLSNKGVFLWSSEMKQAALTASGEVTGTDGNVYTCIKDHTSAAGNKPVTGAEYTTYWIERGSTGGVWVNATDYHNVGQFTPDSKVRFISSAFVRRTEVGDLPLEIITREQYNIIVRKFTEAMPQTLMFDIALDPEVYVWPIPNIMTDVVHYRAYYPLQDFDTATANADAKSNWLKTLGYMLAADISSEYGLPLGERRYLDSKARELLKDAKRTNSQKPTQSLISPAYSGTRRRRKW